MFHVSELVYTVFSIGLVVVFVPLLLCVLLGHVLSRFQIPWWAWPLVYVLAARCTWECIGIMAMLLGKQPAWFMQLTWPLRKAWEFLTYDGFYFVNEIR